MSYYDQDTLYALLPAFIRLRDETEGGGALRALTGVIAGQAEVISAGLDQLYADQFIETCAPWVVPYIGDLIGYRPLRPLGAAGISRTEVADTIGYRRRKGTLAMLEQLAVDVTGWPAVAVEYFSRLATTQYVRCHLRLQNTIVDMHSPMTALDIDGPFDLPPRSVDVRRIESGRGRYNIPNIGLFVWRLAAYGPPPPTATLPAGGAPARLVGANRYTFDPFGGDVPLVNPPAVSADDFVPTQRPNVPFPLQRYPLFAALEPYAQEANQLSPPDPDAAMAPFGVSLQGERIAWANLEICDLTDWSQPTQPGVAVDPDLGRLVFATAPKPTDTVTVDYTYCFSGDYGGGNYARAVDEGEPDPGTGIAISFTGDDPTTKLPGIEQGAVDVIDSGLFTSGDIALAPAENAILVVRAADYQRPVTAGGVTIAASAGATVTLRGIGIGGALTISGGGPFTLQLEHCTVRGGIVWPAAANERPGLITVESCLCGPVSVNAEVVVTIEDSLVDSGSAADSTLAISAPASTPAGSVTIQRSTVLGAVSARTIPLLEDSIVTGPVVSEQRQSGCLRYSYVPVAGSQTPRRFRCQPDLAIDTAITQAVATNPGLTTAQIAAIQAAVSSWLVPAFTSRIPGQPGYGQLADAAPQEITAGADEGDEMGVFYGLWNTRRENNLTFRVNEYLRIGLEAGIIHAS